MDPAKKEMPNPYAPLTEELAVPSDQPVGNWLGLPLLCFLPGTVVGLNLGIAVTEGIPATIQRTTSSPLGALQFFACFSLVCLFVSMLWRIPRRFFLGRHRLRPLACFASGTFMSTGGVATVQILEDQLPIGPGTPYLGFVVTLGIAAVFAVPAVEFEALMGRRLKSVFDPTDVDAMAEESESR